MKEQFFKIIQNKWAILMFCLIFSLLLFSNTFQNDFVFDDVPNIRDNLILKNIQNIPKLFFSYYYRSPTGLYRPIQMASYALNYFLFGDKVWHFHLINILLHALNCWLLFLLISRLIGKKNIAFIAAFLFLILPIHTEAVTGLVGRAELLAFFFSFLTLLILITGQAKKWRLVLASFCLLLALLSKETALAVLPIYLTICAWRNGLLQITNLNELRINLKRSRILQNVAILIFVFFVYLFIRYLVLGPYFSVNNATLVENPLKFVSTGPRIATALKILSLYLWKIIFPLQLSSDYSYNQISVVQNLANWPTIFGFIIIALFIYLLSQPRKTPYSLYLGSAIFFWSFLPVSNLILPIGTIMGERLMYFPSAGICLIVAAVLWRIIQFKPQKIFFAIVLILFTGLTVFYVVRTWLRNYDWQNQKTLFLSAAKASPNSVLSRSNAGAIYLLEGKYDQAEKEILAANQIYPDYPPAVNNLGLIYRQKKNYQKAEELFTKAIKLAGYPPAFENLALIYFDQGKFQESKEILTIFFQNDQTKVQTFLTQLFQIKINEALSSGNQKSAEQWLEKAKKVLAD